MSLCAGYLGKSGSESAGELLFVGAASGGPLLKFGSNSDTMANRWRFLFQ